MFMKKLLLICIYFLSSFSILTAQETVNLKEIKSIDLIIPSPGEMISWGKALQVVPEVTIGQEILSFTYSSKNKESGSIFLGRTLSLLLLGLEKMPDSDILKSFMKIKEGMESLAIDKKYVDQFESLKTQFQKKTLSKTDLTNKLDLAYAQLTSAPDVDTDMFNILQGAAWVQGQNLLAKSIRKNENYQYAKLLLSRPSVVNLIMNSLKNAKAKGGSSETIDPLVEGMESYRKLTAPAILGKGEVEEIIEGTDAFLSNYGKA
jgi:hypothetical protein